MKMEIQKEISKDLFNILQECFPTTWGNIITAPIFKLLGRNRVWGAKSWLGAHPSLSQLGVWMEGEIALSQHSNQEGPIKSDDDTCAP